MLRSLSPPPTISSSIQSDIIPQTTRNITEVMECTSFLQTAYLALWTLILLHFLHACFIQAVDFTIQDLDLWCNKVMRYHFTLLYSIGTDTFNGPFLHVTFFVVLTPDHSNIKKISCYCHHHYYIARSVFIEGVVFFVKDQERNKACSKYHIQYYRHKQMAFTYYFITQEMVICFLIQVKLLHF